MGRAVGRESKAHPAFCIIASPDAERYQLPPIQGYTFRFERSGGSLNKANPQRPRHVIVLYRIVVTVKKNVPPGTKARMYCGMILG
jgi:hypothetical protein